MGGRKWTVVIRGNKDSKSRFEDRVVDKDEMGQGGGSRLIEAESKSESDTMQYVDISHVLAITMRP